MSVVLNDLNRVKVLGSPYGRAKLGGNDGVRLAPAKCLLQGSRWLPFERRIRVTGWTASDLRAWRARMRWTQAQAASALFYHLEAYKRLELGTRIIVPRIAKLAALTEREHIRALVSVSGGPGQRQAFSTPQRVISRLEALALDGRLTKGGRPRLRCLSLFAGIEGATAALERLGSDAVPIAFAEIDPAANAMLRYRWPNVPRVGDVTEFHWAPLRGHIDLIVGGPPCQSFSVAGRRLGLRDPRGNLSLHFLRAVSLIQPRWFLLKNVPGMLSSADGADFEVFLQAVADSGYSCAWRVLDARHFGLPQRRRRLWVVGERSGSASGPESVLALGDGEAGRPASRRPKWKAAARRAQESLGELVPGITDD